MLTATDVSGLVAYGTPLRTWKPGRRSIVFCGDHVNDCWSNQFQLGHGPVSPLAQFVPPLDVDQAGYTWDGGPPPLRPLFQFMESRPAVLASAMGSENGNRFAQTPHLEHSDEGGTAVTSAQDRVFADDLERVVNAWHTFGPIAGASRLFNASLRTRIWFQASTKIPDVAYAGMSAGSSWAASLFESVTTFKVDNNVTDAYLAFGGHDQQSYEVAQLLVLVARDQDSAPEVLRCTDRNFTQQTRTIKAGGWWGFVSSTPGQTQLYTSRGDDFVLQVSSPARTFVYARPPTPLRVSAGDTFRFEIAQISLSLLSPSANSSHDLLSMRALVTQPPGLVFTSGARDLSAQAAGLLEVVLDQRGVCAFRLDQTPDVTAMLPLRFAVRNRRWTCGMWQVNGFVIGNYGANGQRRWTALGISGDGFAHAPLYAGLSALSVVVGHPVVADAAAGEALIIQCVQAENMRVGTADKWHVVVNNPTNNTIITTFSKVIPIEELHLTNDSLSVAPGEWTIISV